jgi:hypothetical protein
MSGRPSHCSHEDWPCCGCGEEPSQEEQHEQWLADQNDRDDHDFDDDDDEFEPGDEPHEMSDVEADADTLKSAGYGTDEDYGDYGDNFYEE